MITAQEIINKFNLHYDNISSGGAPGINNYEMSIFLTQAFREVIFNQYNGNVKGEAIDETERMKSLLGLLTLTGQITGQNLVQSSELINNKYYKTQVTFDEAKLPWFILKEYIISSGKIIKVRPILQDEFLLIIENPYKAPNINKVLRLDETLTDDGYRSIVLISHIPIVEYNYTYLQFPHPIILSNLQDIMPELTIEGNYLPTIPTVLEKNLWLLELVINRAVELATRDYKQNSLETMVSLNSRIE